MQTITTPNGETLVILPIAEYERLTEAADIAAARKVKADIAAGNDELVPAGIVNRILEGESPLRVWRTYRGMTGKHLAELTGLSAPYISEIETGKKEGSVSAMKRMADALNVNLDDIV